jgi:hypothetical protein
MRYQLISAAVCAALLASGTAMADGTTPAQSPYKNCVKQERATSGITKGEAKAKCKSLLDTQSHSSNESSSAAPSNVTRPGSDDSQSAAPAMPAPNPGKDLTPP